MGLEVDASSLLPPDDSADGFDNNADLLWVSPALLERYLSSAAKISALAVGSAKIAPGSEMYRIRETRRRRVRTSRCRRAHEAA